MFEQNQAIGDMIESLYKICKPLKRGDLLTREVIQSVVGVEPNTAHWQHVMNRVRRRVERERSISMMPMLGLGFSLCTIQEQLELAAYRQKRANRQLFRGKRSLEALGGEKRLSDHQMRARLVALESLARSRHQIAYELKLVRSLRRPTLTLPRLHPASVQAATA